MIQCDASHPLAESLDGAAPAAELRSASGDCVAWTPLKKPKDSRKMDAGRTQMKN
jgi:hypothetical protein